jgi:hypothetical protein
MDNIFKFKAGALVAALHSLNSLLFSLFELFVKSIFVVSFGGSIVYDNTISDAVKSTLNNWFSDTPEQNNNNSASLLMVPLIITRDIFSLSWFRL